jgi:4-amino-4-deoxy-L-arabinose transferase-like glycosyltransferase
MVTGAGAARVRRRWDAGVRTVTEATVGRPASRGAATPLLLAAGFVLCLTLVRLAVLFASPLELYPDEAQYWSWSRSLAFGYFSKPPLIAWLIHVTTALGGDDEPWVRLSAPLLHAGAALALQRAGTRLYDGWAGFWAAVIYSLMPGVQLSAGVMSTDAPLLFLLSMALWAYAGLQHAGSRRERLACAAGLGCALGLAMLSKYAGLYFVAGLGLHAAISVQARRAWGRWEIALAAGLGLLLLAPNLAWNARHGFATLGHLLANADWLPDPDEIPQAAPLISLDLRQTPGFLASQLLVFGPIPFLVLVGGGVAMARRLQPADRLLLVLVAPPLAVVVLQAMIARANANWAGAAYAPGSVLVAAWLVRWRAWRWLQAALVMQGLTAALFMAAAASPALADRAGFANSFKRVRGWSASTQAVLARARAEHGLTAIAVDDRFLFDAMTYYGRDYFDDPGAVPLTMWMRRPKANTQAELEAPLTPALGARVLAASLDDVYLDEMQGDFPRSGPPATVAIPLDPTRRRRVSLFVGEGFSPAPRDPATGLPIRRASPTTASALPGVGPGAAAQR